MSRDYLTVSVRVSDYVDVDIPYDSLDEEKLVRALAAKRGINIEPDLFGGNGPFSAYPWRELVASLYDRYRALPLDQRPPEVCELVYRSLGRIL